MKCAIIIKLQDHVGKAYLSLFQVATFKGWIQVNCICINLHKEPFVTWL